MTVATFPRAPGAATQAAVADRLSATACTHGDELFLSAKSAAPESLVAMALSSRTNWLMSVQHHTPQNWRTTSLSRRWMPSRWLMVRRSRPCRGHRRRVLAVVCHQPCSASQQAESSQLATPYEWRLRGSCGEPCTRRVGVHGWSLRKGAMLIGLFIGDAGHLMVSHADLA